jgi:hypothetical protein
MSALGIVPQTAPEQWDNSIVSCSGPGRIHHDSPSSRTPDVNHPRSRLAGCTKQKEALDGE